MSIFLISSSNLILPTWPGGKWISTFLSKSRYLLSISISILLSILASILLSMLSVKPGLLPNLNSGVSIFIWGPFIFISPSIFPSFSISDNFKWAEFDFFSEILSIFSLLLSSIRLLFDSFIFFEFCEIEIFILSFLFELFFSMELSFGRLFSFSFSVISSFSFWSEFIIICFSSLLLLWFSILSLANGILKLYLKFFKILFLFLNFISPSLSSSSSFPFFPFFGSYLTKLNLFLFFWKKIISGWCLLKSGNI